jgi:hypothetical protein
VNDVNMSFVQLFQCPFAIIMEHLIEMPTYERPFANFVCISSPLVPPVT